MRMFNIGFAKSQSFHFVILISILLVSFISGCEAPSDTEQITDLNKQGITETIEDKNSYNDSLSEPYTWNNESVVETKYGKLGGKEMDNGTWAYLGVPYAKPPVSELRWAPPEDPDSWDGIKDATSSCNICPQYGNVLNETGQGTFKGEVVGDEDCLYMNIYRPKTEEILPVFVFFHGGANYIGRQDRSYFNGKHFVDRSDMILVTLNYRIGMLGWFSHSALRTGDPIEDSGNFGTLDTIQGLKWIQENIALFGGDPDNVTVCGQSAGAWNIFALMVSPLSKGLYHKVILMSGQPTSESLKRAEKSAQCIVERLLIQDEYLADDEEAMDFIQFKGDEWIADYLRSKDISELYHPDYGGPSGILLDKNYCTGPYIDGTVIPMDPNKILKTGNYDKVPVILGCTTDELKLFVPLLAADSDDLFHLIQVFDPDNPEFCLNDLLKPILWPIIAVYEPFNIFGKLLNQLYGTDSVAKKLSKNQEDVYLYKFSWDEEPKPFDFLTGACHSIDLPFLFGMFPEGENCFFRFAWSEENREGREIVSDSMITYFSQFAKTGNPNISESDLPEWKTYKNKRNAEKRIVFDSDGPYMSSADFEKGEITDFKTFVNDIRALF